jgi:hypothetical protein
MSDPSAPTLSETVEKAVEAAEETIRQPAVKRFARLGFYAKGFLFIVIGALAILLVAGYPEGRIADPTGALAIIAEGKFGTVLLAAFVIGAAAHGLWNILRALADVDDAGRNWLGITKRVIAAGVGIFYIGLALTALEIMLDARVVDGPSRAEETFVSLLLSVPILGAILLLLIGLGVIGAGFHECYNGVSGKFRDAYRVWEITGPHHAFINVLGIVSFSARALLMVIMGYFFVSAALWSRVDGSIGLDAALTALALSTYGRILLFSVAVGLFAHGVLAFYEAKYRRIC